MCVHAKLLKSCSTLCDPIDRSPPGSSVHGILQAKILGWAAIPFSRGSSQPGIEPGSPALAVRLFIVWATRKSQEALLSNKSNPINPISNKYQSKGLIFLATEVFVVRAVLWIVGCLAGSLARSQEHSHCTLWQANVFQTFLSVPQEDKIVLS